MKLNFTKQLRPTLHSSHILTIILMHESCAVDCFLMHHSHFHRSCPYSNCKMATDQVKTFIWFRTRKFKFSSQKSEITKKKNKIEKKNKLHWIWWTMEQRSTKVWLLQMNNEGAQWCGFNLLQFAAWIKHFEDEAIENWNKFGLINFKRNCTTINYFFFENVFMPLRLFGIQIFQLQFRVH